MPQASKTEHRIVTNTALPYISNASLTSTDPHLLQGSQNVLTSLRNWMENRPGFSTAFDTSPFVNVQRNFVWRRWSNSSPNGGAFVWMVCDVSGGHALVYKKVIGVDSAPILLFTSSSAEPFDFVVSDNTCFFGNGTDMYQFDSNRFVSWGIASPVAGPTLTLISGSMNVFTSWCYCTTYFDSYNGHESSPSPISACSGVFSSKNVQLGLVASTNPRVTNIRVYRTPDGGAQDPALMQEISNSPFPNTTGNVTDTTPDTSLSIRTAPEFLRNDPPTPSKGFVSYAGRIWGFTNNVTVYSGFEEIPNGVPEECWPSGLTGNFYPWANEVFGHASLIDGIAVLQATNISKIEGDTLDTFRRYTLLEKRGTRSRTTVASLGGSVVWLDTSNTIWLSDLGEIGIPIRPDLQSINPATCWITLHISGVYHWVVVLDGTNGLLYVYDLDRSAWMPPWTIGQASGLFSGETALGNINLLVTLKNVGVSTVTTSSVALINFPQTIIVASSAGLTNGDPVLFDSGANQETVVISSVSASPPSFVATFTKTHNAGVTVTPIPLNTMNLTPGTYSDGTMTYTPIAQTNLYALTPDGNPSFQGVHDWSEIKTDTVPPAKVLQLTDDDPTQAAYTDITANGEPSPLITQGQYLQSWRYTSNNPSAAFMSMKFIWPQGQQFHLYQMDEAMHGSGG